MSDSRFCVYKHTSPNGKIYIGITSLTPERRWNKGAGYKYQPLFYKAILKYGWDNFKHEILHENLDHEEASRIERELIERHKATDPKCGYNLSSGGFGGCLGLKNSEETKRRKSESAKRAWADPNRRRVTRRKIVNGVKIRAGHTGLGHKKKPVLQYTLDNSFVKRWVSVCEIERELGIHSGKISECCNGKRLSVKGYRWVFEEVVT